MPDGGLEFDQGMGTIVTQRWNSFAIGTKIGIMADSTLVTCATDVLLAGLAGTEMPIAVNPEMHLLVSAEVSNLLEQSGETVTGMDLRGVKNAGGAVIPVRAAQTLVTDTKDVLRYSISQTQARAGQRLDSPCHSHHRSLHVQGHALHHIETGDAG